MAVEIAAAAIPRGLHEGGQVVALREEIQSRSLVRAWRHIEFDAGYGDSSAFLKEERTGVNWSGARRVQNEPQSCATWAILPGPASFLQDRDSGVRRLSPF